MIIFYFDFPVQFPNNTYFKKPNGLCNRCYKWRMPLVTVPPRNFCIPAHQAELDLVLLVTSIHKNRLHRRVIRDTWGNYAQTNHSRIRVVFTFGLDPEGNQTEEAKLRQEASDFGDILQVNLNGTYSSLPEIVMNSYAWVLANCTKAKFIGKLSDDAYINIPELLRLLDTHGEDQLHDVLFGQCLRGANPVRTPGKKWYVSKKKYPFKRFPSYCSGAAFFLSRNILGEITDAVSNIAFPTGHDDVLLGTAIRITGHCPCTIPGFSLFRPPRGERLYRRGLVQHGDINCRHYRTFQYRLGFHFHGVDPALIAQVWRYRSCSTGKHSDFSVLKCPRKGTCDEDFYHIEKSRKIWKKLLQRYYTTRMCCNGTFHLETPLDHITTHWHPLSN